MLGRTEILIIKSVTQWEFLISSELNSKFFVTHAMSIILNIVFHAPVNIGKTKYMEIGRHRGVIANAHIKIGSNSYEEVKPLNT